ncbi:MAG: hypothetical protein JNJ76_09470 [Candidatus Competibacter sp.]|nr:hypothetical protein [Candidatus Competibacter sp.]
MNDKTIIVLSARELSKSLKTNEAGVARRVVRGELPRPNVKLVHRNDMGWSLDFLKETSPEVAAKVEEHMVA